MSIEQFCKAREIQSEYKKKLVTADEAVKVVKSGDRIHYGLFCGIVRELDKALDWKAPITKSSRPPVPPIC